MIVIPVSWSSIQVAKPLQACVTVAGQNKDCQAQVTLIATQIYLTFMPKNPDI